MPTVSEARVVSQHSMGRVFTCARCGSQVSDTYYNNVELNQPPERTDEGLCYGCTRAERKRAHANR